MSSLCARIRRQNVSPYCCRIYEQEGRSACASIWRGEWLRLGFPIDFVVTSKTGELLPLVPEGANIISLETMRLRHSIRPLVTYLRRNRPAVLLAAMWPLTLVAIVATRIARTGNLVVVSDHVTLSRQYADWGAMHRAALRATIAAIYPLADVRIAVSRGVADDLSQLSGIARDQFSVIFNPAATGKNGSRTNGSRRQLGAARTILNVGTLKRQKNQDLLIEAFARLEPSADTRLIILGEGEMRAALERLIEQRGLQKRVVLEGFVLDPTPYYESADLFVLSSRYEGFGNVIVEALEHGVPVVSTDCPAGPREILEDGRYGCLVPVGDAPALAHAMAEALRRRHDQSALRARAQDFSVAKISREYLDVMIPGWREASS